MDQTVQIPTGGDDPVSARKDPSQRRHYLVLRIQCLKTQHHFHCRTGTLAICINLSRWSSTLSLSLHSPDHLHLSRHKVQSLDCLIKSAPTTKHQREEQDRHHGTNHINPSIPCFHHDSCHDRKHMCCFTRDGLQALFQGHHWNPAL